MIIESRRVGMGALAAIIIGNAQTTAGSSGNQSIGAPLATIRSKVWLYEIVSGYSPAAANATRSVLPLSSTAR